MSISIASCKVNENIMLFVQVLSMFQMLARGQVTSLDDELTKYCPDFSMSTNYNITLRQMAAQVSDLHIIYPE